MHERTEIEARVASLPPDAAHQALLDLGVLGYQECIECGRAVFPPRVLCPRCGADSLRWQRSSGEGSIYSVTTVAPRGEEPYAIALVDLAEGFRMMTAIAGVPAAKVHIGLRVRHVSEPANGRPATAFTIEDGQI